MELRHLHHLVLLADELSFTRAADRANLSQTAFSRSIQVLERDLNVRLFDRKTRSVALTAVGAQLVSRARTLAHDVEIFSQEASYLANGQGGRMAMGASLLASDVFLRARVPAWATVFPGTQITVKVGQWRTLKSLLEHGEIEFFIGYPGDIDLDPEFVVHTLDSQATSVFCRADHPLLANSGGKRTIRTRQLLAFPWASVASMDHSDTRRLASHFQLDSESELPWSLLCDHLDVLRDATLLGDSLLFSWRSWVQPYLERGEMVDLADYLSERIPDNPLSCAVVHPRGRSLSPMADRVIAMLTTFHAR